MPSGLDALLPEYRAQYEALMPEIERSVRGDLVRRGMNYSGEAGDALARAQAKLLAELAGKSANTRADQSEAARQREFAASEGAAGRREAARAQRLGLIGSAVGGLGTLGAMYAMRQPVQPNITAIGDRGFTYQDGRLKAIPFEGVEGGVTPAGGGVTLDGQSPRTPPTSPGGPASMWKKAGGFGGLAAGAGGGLLGSQLSTLLAGRDTGTEGDVGAGLGGLAGMGLAGMSRYGGSPWAAGLGALLGAGGGGLLGNLFR